MKIPPRRDLCSSEYIKTCKREAISSVKNLWGLNFIFIYHLIFPSQTDQYWKPLRESISDNDSAMNTWSEIHHVISITYWPGQEMTKRKLTNARTLTTRKLTKRVSSRQSTGQIEPKTEIKISTVINMGGRCQHLYCQQNIELFPNRYTLRWKPTDPLEWQKFG